MRWLIIPLAGVLVALVTYFNQPLGLAMTTFVIIVHELHEITA